MTVQEFEEQEKIQEVTTILTRIFISVWNELYEDLEPQEEYMTFAEIKEIKL